MGATLYIVIEGEDPGFDTFVKGRAITRAEDALARLAHRLGVRSLLEFFSADSHSMELLRQEGYDVPPVSFGVVMPPEWFSPQDGLRTIAALREYLGRDPQYLGADAHEVLAELDEYRVVLEKAAERNLRWHLSVSWR